MAALFVSFGTKSLFRGRKFIRNIYGNPIPPWMDKLFFQNLYKIHNLYFLIPKNPWDQKLVDCSLELWAACMKKSNLYFYFYFDKWTTYFTSFPGIPSTSNLTLYEPMVKFCSKQVLRSFFLYFLSRSYMQSCGWNCPRAKGQGAKKEVCFTYRILVFSLFFTFFLTHGSTWYYHQCDYFDLNVNFFIFFKKILQGPQCWSFESRSLSTKRILVHS
jgi:hypothetical protein